jgi:CBS domain-containing protein
MTTVKDILNQKGTPVWSVGAQDTVLEALTMLEKRDVGALVVENAFGRVVGIVSERDYARKVELKERRAGEVLVQDIMTPVNEVFGVKPETTIEECMVLISERKVRHLPVFSGSRVMGLVSIGDVLKLTIEEKEEEIEHLNRYIAGGYV